MAEGGEPSVLLKVRVTFKDNTQQLRYLRVYNNMVGHAIDKTTNVMMEIMPSISWKDTVQVYKNWVSLTCKVDWAQGRMYTINDVSGEERLPLRKVKTMSIEEIRHGGGLSILNQLSTSDSVWMKRKPMKTYRAVSFLCGIQIYQFSPDPNVYAFISRLLYQIRSAPKTFDGESILQTYIHNIRRKYLVIVGSCYC